MSWYRENQNQEKVKTRYVIWWVLSMIDYTNSEISKLIDEYIHSERDRAILKRRLIDGVCYEPLSEEFDLSPKQVRNIVRKAEQKLFKHME